MHTKKQELLYIITVTLVALCLVYYYYFPYADTDAGHQKAVETFLKNGELSQSSIQIRSSVERDGFLYLYFRADDTNNRHGILQLEHGINGRYRPLEMRYGALPYSEGAYLNYFLTHLYTRAADEPPIRKYYLLGTDLSENSNIKSFELTCAYTVAEDRPEREYRISHTIPADSIQALTVFSQEEFEGMFAFHQPPYYVNLEGVRALDADGNDITEDYLIPSAVDADGSASSVISASYDLYPTAFILIIFVGVLCLIRWLRQQ